MVNANNANFFFIAGCTVGTKPVPVSLVRGACESVHRGTETAGQTASLKREMIQIIHLFPANLTRNV